MSTNAVHSTQATTWNHAYGGSTLIVHVEGAMVPGVPSLLEYLKADVHLPPHLVQEYPDCRCTVAAIVQAYIEEIGVRTAERYTAAGQDFGWSFSSGGPVILTIYPSFQHLQNRDHPTTFFVVAFMEVLPSSLHLLIDPPLSMVHQSYQKLQPHRHHRSLVSAIFQKNWMFSIWR